MCGSFPRRPDYNARHAPVQSARLPRRSLVGTVRGRPVVSGVPVCRNKNEGAGHAPLVIPEDSRRRRPALPRRRVQAGRDDARRNRPATRHRSTCRKPTRSGCSRRPGLCWPTAADADLGEAPAGVAGLCGREVWVSAFRHRGADYAEGLGLADCVVDGLRKASKAATESTAFSREIAGRLDQVRVKIDVLDEDRKVTRKYRSYDSNRSKNYLGRMWEPGWWGASAVIDGKRYYIVPDTVVYKGWGLVPKYRDNDKKGRRKRRDVGEVPARRAGEDGGRDADGGVAVRPAALHDRRLHRRVAGKRLAGPDARQRPAPAGVHAPGDAPDGDRCRRPAPAAPDRPGDVRLLV